MSFKWPGIALVVAAGGVALLWVATRPEGVSPTPMGDGRDDDRISPPASRPAVPEAGEGRVDEPPGDPGSPSQIAAHHPPPADPWWSAVATETMTTLEARVLKLPQRLSGTEYDALLRLVALPWTNTMLRPGEVHAVKNTMLDRLFLQRERIDQTAAYFLDAYDRMPEMVTRDYVVQHLGEAVSQMADPGQVVDLLWRETGNTASPSLAGTALLALTRRAGEPSGIEADRVAQIACQIAASPTYPESVRATAIQVAMRLGDSAICPIAREQLSRGGGYVLRAAAIAALGGLSEEVGDREMLRAMLADGDVRLEAALQTALKKMEEL